MLRCGRGAALAGRGGMKAALLLLWLALASLSARAEWTSELAGGGRVSVDPATNRATVTRGGVTTPLWDGVHRLKDGSAITVRSGQVVPNAGILRERHPRPPEPRPDEARKWVGQPIVGASPCERLVRNVCGDQGECAGAPACAPARHLLVEERRERSQSPTPDRMTYSSGQCRVAAGDKAFFRACRPGRR